MMRKLLLVCAALLAIAAVDQTDAACKVKSESASEAATSGSSNSTANKIQAAPKNRLTNKLLFDVPVTKSSSDEDEDDEE